MASLGSTRRHREAGGGGKQSTEAVSHVEIQWVPRKVWNNLPVGGLIAKWLHVKEGLTELGESPGAERGSRYQRKNQQTCSLSKPKVSSSLIEVAKTSKLFLFFKIYHVHFYKRRIIFADLPSG